MLTKIIAENTNTSMNTLYEEWVNNYMKQYPSFMDFYELKTKENLRHY